MKSACGWCRSELWPEKLLVDHDGDRPKQIPTQHGHRLYIVAGGTTWRFVWAPTKDDAVGWVRKVGATRGAPLKAWAARWTDLEVVADVRGEEKRVRA